MQPAPDGWPRIASSLFYDDPRSAIDWLCKAFGFEVRLIVESWFVQRLRTGDPDWSKVRDKVDRSEHG